MCNGPYNRYNYNNGASSANDGASSSSSYDQMQNVYGGHAYNYQAGGDNKKRSTAASILKNSPGIQALNKEVLMWAGFLTVSLFVFFALSGGHFSFLLTYGGLARAFGFAILNLKIFGSKKTSGISAATLQLYSAVFLFRLASVTFHEGYLPYDKSGDWLYHLVEGTSLILSATALWAVMASPFKSITANDMNALYFAGPVLIMAIAAHPNLNENIVSDVAWTYAMYLESVALIPQLAMFRSTKKSKSSSPAAGGVIEPLTAHFVFALGFGRLVEFSFWIFNYTE